MKVINSSVELMRSGLETEMIRPEKFIEKVGRTCYKSEDKITDDSAAKFVGNLIKRGHEAMIEHWNLIFRTSGAWYKDIINDWTTLLTSKYIDTERHLRPFLNFTEGIDRYIISGNMRAWRDYLAAYKEVYGCAPVYLYGMIRCNPIFFPEFQDYVPPAIVNDILIPIEARELEGEREKAIHHNVTMKFICDRGVSHEMVRHRVASFAQESTRYCNYSGDKYGKEITVIAPSWCDRSSPDYDIWYDACSVAEDRYIVLINQGRSPQEARSVLPNSLKTEIIVTMNLDGWKHFCDLRCDKAAHPDIQVVAKMAKEYLTKVAPEMFEEKEN